MRSRPKILSIIPYQVYPAQLGGEKGIAVFNKYLSEQADLVAITIRRNNPALAPYPLHNVISNSRSRYGNLLLYRTVRKYINKYKPSHLLIEHPYFGWLAWMIKKTTRITWVVHSHNMEYQRSKSIGRSWWKALKAYEAWVYRSADKVFFISDDDREHAITHLGMSREKSLTVTYGVEQNAIPGDLAACKNEIMQRHHIPDDTRILLFNGALYHSTNYEALQVILDSINPVLMQTPAYRYKILVCGKGLPSFFNDLKDYSNSNVIYAGFVDNIDTYFKAADVFLNPILAGGGVKTKAIEALAMNCSVVSTPLGALGLKKEVCGNKLHVVEEGNWMEFAKEVMHLSSQLQQTPPEFFTYYAWPNIIGRVVSNLNNDIT